MEQAVIKLMACGRCARGRVMFDGEDLSCVQCGWRSPAEIDPRDALRPAA
ncbi:MAG: hypothetical protein AB7I38_14780 [Dehalococcoidia bacterium]